MTMTKKHWAVLAVSLVASPLLGANDAAAQTADWSGFYVGAIAGYGWGEGTYCDVGCTFIGPTVETDGFMGGATVGYNHQFDSVVLGIEADYMFGAIDGSTAVGPVPGPSGAFGCNVTGCQVNYDGMGTVRARLGYAFGSLLPFATGGIAIIGAETVQGVTNNTALYSAVVGGGLEYAFNEQLSVKAEYLHVFENDKLVDAFVCSATGCHATNFSLDVVRVGLNYHF